MELIKETGVPHWMQPPPPPAQSLPDGAKDRAYLTDATKEVQYTEWHWEETLRRLSGGETLRSVCRDENMPEYGRFQRWIHDKDHPDRKKRYREAQMYATETMSDDMREEMEDHCDEHGNPKDLEWIKEKNRTRKFLMASWNRDRYSEKQQAQANVNVNVGALALDALRKRTIDVTPEETVEVIENV